MLTYADYLKEWCDNYDMLSKDEFEKIVKPFANEDISLENFELETNLEEYLLSEVIGKISSFAYAEEVNADNGVYVTGIDTVEELDQINAKLKSLGYYIEDYEGIKNDIIEYQKDQEEIRIYNKVRSLINNLKTEDLAEILNKYANKA